MKKPFERVAVVGVGVLGTQIAMLSAYAGYKVIAFDTRANAFDDTYDRLFADLKAKVANPFIPWNDWAECKKRIAFTTSLTEALKDVDLVVEAATEDVELKKKIFKQMGEGRATQGDLRHKQFISPRISDGRKQRPAGEVHKHSLLPSAPRDEHGGYHGWNKDPDRGS